MNPTAELLLAQFARLGLGEVEGLNLLTENGLISDNAVFWGDIADEDAEVSTEILKGFMTAEIPTYTQEQYDEAKKKSDALQEEVEATGALQGEVPRELFSRFSKAVKLMNFYKRRLEDQG